MVQNMYRKHEEKWVFSERKKIEFDLSVNVTECLQQIEIPNLLHMCAQCFDLPFHIIIHTPGQLARFYMFISNITLSKFEF